jgi:ketosteroid isomerase-like protein
MVRSAYAAFATRDLTLLRELAHPDVEISTVTGLVAGHEEPYRGYAGLERYMDDVRSVWDEIELIPQQFSELERGRLLVFGRVRGRRGSTLIDAPNAWLWTFREGMFVSSKFLSVRIEEMRLKGV